MNRYETIIYWSESDQAYIAEIPELPGCMADGSTRQDALAMVDRIADEWIQTASSFGPSHPQAIGACSMSE
jgi:predicted RNase H-like HicB family nuclease